MFAHSVQYPTQGTIPTSINLSDNSYFGTWGTPILTTPLNSDALRNIRTLTSSDFINYPVQTNFLTNNALNGHAYGFGLPWLQNGLETLNPWNTSLGIAAINGGVLPTAINASVPGFSPFNFVPGLNQVVPGVDYAGIPSAWSSHWNPISQAVAQAYLLGTPFNALTNPLSRGSVWGNSLYDLVQRNSVVSSPFGNPYNAAALASPYIASALGNPYQAGFMNPLQQSLLASNPLNTVLGSNPFYGNLAGTPYFNTGYGINGGCATTPSTIYGGGFFNHSTNSETQAILQGIVGIGQVNFIDNDSEVIFECSVPGISSSNIEVIVVQNQIRVRLIPTAGQRSAGTTSASSSTATSRTNSTNLGTTPIYNLPVPAFTDINKINARVDNGRLVISVPRSNDYQKNITRVKVS